MAKNRKISKKMSVIAQGSTMLCAVIVMLFVMVVVNLLADSSCSQLMKSIGAKEAQLKRLTKGTEVPTEQEIAENPRAASAKLRAVERIRATMDGARR